MRFWLAISAVAVGAAVVACLAENTSAKPAPIKQQQCHGARRAVVFYRTQTWAWQEKRQARDYANRPPTVRGRSCGFARAAAREWRARAQKANRRYQRWHDYQYAWWQWLPSKWQRIGACETGYGRRPGNWRHANSSFQGAFGFAVSSWDSFVPRADPKAGPYPSEAYLATPRQQYEVALAIYRMYGLSGWGCRNA